MVKVAQCFAWKDRDVVSEESHQSDFDSDESHDSHHESDRNATHYIDKYERVAIVFRFSSNCFTIPYSGKFLCEAHIFAIFAIGYVPTEPRIYSFREHLPPGVASIVSLALLPTCTSTAIPQGTLSTTASLTVAN